MYLFLTHAAHQWTRHLTRRPEDWLFQSLWCLMIWLNSERLFMFLLSFGQGSKLVSSGGWTSALGSIAVLSSNCVVHVLLSYRKLQVSGSVPVDLDLLVLFKCFLAFFYYLIYFWGLWYLWQSQSDDCCEISLDQRFQTWVDLFVSDCMFRRFKKTKQNNNNCCAQKRLTGCCVFVLPISAGS